MSERAIEPACGHDGDLLFERDEAFDDCLRGADGRPRRVNVVRSLDLRLALAVVSEAGNLENAGEKFGRGIPDVVFAEDRGERAA